MPVTLDPTPPVMVWVPVLVPELVRVPMLLTLAVVKVTRPVVPVLLMLRLPVPVTPPDRVRVSVVMEVTFKSWLNVMGPLKVDARVCVRVAVPLLPEATEMAFVKGPAKPPLKVALALPTASPRVMVFAPKALALVVPTTVPALMVNPPVNVLAPERVHVPVPALVTVPATVPIMLAKLLAVLVPSRVNPNPEPVIVPAAERTIFPALATMLLALPKVINPL